MPVEASGARELPSELVPMITLTGTDGKARPAEHETFQTSASEMVRKAGRDIVQGEQVLNATLQDTFTTRAIWVMIVEAEKYIKAGGGEGLMPEGWVPALLSLINKAEAQIINARANADRNKGRFLALPPSDRIRCHKAPQRFVAAEPQRSLSDDSGILRELANKNTAHSLVPHFRTLENLEFEIQVMFFVIETEKMRIAALEYPIMSDAVFKSVLEEEADILTTIQDQISDLYEIPDGMGEALGENILQQKLEALTTQTEAVFNIQNWEKKQEASSAAIDDGTTRSIGAENQERMEILRKIQDILETKRATRQQMSVVRGR